MYEKRKKRRINNLASLNIPRLREQLNDVVLELQRPRRHRCQQFPSGTIINAFSIDVTLKTWDVAVDAVNERLKQVVRTARG